MQRPLQAPRPRKRAAQVLDEDVYTDSMEAIIERDYFPDLPKLRNKLDWLEALRSGMRCISHALPRPSQLPTILCLSELRVASLPGRGPYPPCSAFIFVTIMYFFRRRSVLISASILQNKS